LIEGAKSPEAGRRFIEFSLSEEGQMLLLDPKISRLPVLPSIYAKAPAGYPNPFGGKIQAKVNFDSNLSEARYYVVLSLFDQMITFRHKELVAALKEIHEADKRLGGRKSTQLDEARKLVLMPAIDEKQAADKKLLDLFKANKADATASQAKAKVEEEWAAKIKANYAKAVELAKSAK
jgi:phosphoglycerate transport regulatory protein PgtC